MNPDEYFEMLEQRFEAAVKRAAEDTEQFGEQQIRNRIPAKRNKTRRAVKGQLYTTSYGFSLRYGLRFAEKYQINEQTQSYRYFVVAWRARRRVVFEYFEAGLMKELATN